MGAPDQPAFDCTHDASLGNENMLPSQQLQASWRNQLRYCQPHSKHPSAPCTSTCTSTSRTQLPKPGRILTKPNPGHRGRSAASTQEKPTDQELRGRPALVTHHVEKRKQELTRFILRDLNVPLASS
eukprot:TRINITY_DN56021_c0_g1_i2.p1 TRINITY_DN56021_c0_g1~~TRINITY_DN56021_c0_g1_i2.p1  ORF type:complete len:127 (-),score=11.41 TRINITY_DN56021_c0_g1_i2:245-625(-)